MCGCVWVCRNSEIIPTFFQLPSNEKWCFFFRCDRLCSDEKYIRFVRKVWFSPLILTTVKQNFWFRSYLGNSWKGLQRKSFIFHSITMLVAWGWLGGIKIPSLSFGKKHLNSPLKAMPLIGNLYFSPQDSEVTFQYLPAVLKLSYKCKPADNSKLLMPAGREFQFNK